MSFLAPRVLTRPWLWLPSKWSHDLAPSVLPLIAGIGKVSEKHWRPFHWRGLQFENPLGIAGGVDKSGACLKAWLNLGAGFVEVGTVTPKPQGPNPGKIMDRDILREALWNKMGFPNLGSIALAKCLEKQKSFGAPVFVNVGKNRSTLNSSAHLDYITCMNDLKPFADVFVVNVSSPNTQGLRDLLEPGELKNFLAAIREETSSSVTQPILLKLSPDMETDRLKDVLRVSSPLVDGWILTNTTRHREAGMKFPSEGGMSGRPLASLSLQALQAASTFKREHPDKLLISVGGLSSAQDVLNRMAVGADLVQFYSALVFQGPHFFKKLLSDLQKHSGASSQTMT